VVYKKYIVKDGKTYGPYVYHSHRVDGKVVSDYHGNSLKKRRHFILGGMIFLISLIIILAVVQLTPKESFNFTINSKSLNGISNSAKVIPQEQVKNLGNSILKFIGFATEEGEISDDSDSSESSSDINSEEASEEETEISSEEVVAPEENSVEEETSESITLEEIPVEETTTETSEEETEIPAEETQEEINETSEETQTEVNETITEESISGELSNNTTSEEETEVNETITEETQKNNISSFDTNNSDVPVNNESINTTASETNETIVSNKTTDSIIVPIINETENTQQNETTKQFKAVIGKPVKWIKTITINSSEDSLVELPKQAENITIKTGDEIASALEQVGEYENLVENSDRQDIVSGGITGFVSSDIKNNLGLFNKILVWFRSLSLTGNAISEEEISNDITETADNTIVDVSNVVSEENVEEIAIEYYTEAPQAIETEKPNGKEITISAADELNYTEILAYTLISEDYGIKDESSIKLLWKNENSLSVNFDAYDLDNNGILDYIEWIVPHLSNQTYELIIEISDAQHLDENRVFIENIFPLVELRDNNYSLIPKEHYVRVSFKQNLTNKNDITIYARGNGSSVLVYEKDLDVEIARFENIIEDKKYQILLTNLSEDYSQDTFDLRSVGDVEYDYIVDPVTKLNDTDLIADVLYFNAAQSYGNQMMFNISSIPDTNTVTHAQVCLYEYTAEGALDNRVTYWFINNNTWAESISATQLNAMTGLNATNTTLSAGVLSWTCFNVTEIVGMAHINQTGLFSIRFEHPSFMVGTASNLLDTQSLTIGGDEGGGIYATRGFEDNENFGGTGNYPYLNVTSVPAPIDLTLEDLASDVGYKYNWGMGYDYGSQVKFNITQLGTGVNISQASLCLYIVEKLEDMGLDDDVSVWYISDQDWTEASSAATLDAQVITNNTNTTFSSSAKNTWGCFNITNQLKESLSKGDKNLSIRFEDGDNRVTTFDGINNALEIGFLASGSYSLYRFEDGENTNETGNAPYINISYGSTSDTTAPNLNITYPVNATTYSVNISNLNYTYSDSSSGYCWYSTDMGVTNSTSVVAGINFTLITSVEGQNNWTLYCNNSLNNLNSTRITFTKDTITQKITLNGSDNLADLGYANFWGMDGYNYGSQIKFNISTIESGANISDGTLCFYVVEKLVDTALDDDVSVWYINDQDWTDLTEYEALAAQSRLNNTNTTLSSSDKNTWACFNVTSQLQQSFLNGNKNFTIRFEDPDNLVSIIQYINSNLQIGFSDSGSYTLYRFEDGENKNESGKLPYLNVTYTSGGAVDAEYPLFFSPVETPANGSQYYPNAKYEFNISINSTNGTAGLQFNNVNYTATNLSGNRFNVTLVNIEAGNFTYQWWGKGNGTSHNPNASQLYMYTLLKNSSTSVNLTLNNTQFNITIPQNTVINLNCSLVYGDAGIRINLYNNGTLINNGTSPLYNSTNFTIDGMYNISCFYLNSQNYSGYSEIFWVNVTAVDSIAPSVTLLTESPTDPASYSLTGLGIYEFNITAIDTSSISVAKLEFNGINYTASNISNIYNVTLPINLGADVYNYSWYVNDTLGNKNNSQNGSYSVNPIAQSIIVLLNGNNANLSVIYPQQINASYNGTNATTLLIKINESVVNAGFNYTWGAGNWVVNYSISTTQNYTGFHDLLKLEINRTTSEVNLTLNNTKGNITIMNGTIIDLNCSLVNGDFGERILLYNNGTLINNGTSPLHNATNFTLVADFNITCIYELTQNYSLSSEIFWVNSTNITLGCSNTGWSDWSSWSACDAGSQYRTRIDSTGCSQSETQSCDSGGGGGDDGGDTTTITTITEPPIICTPDCSGKTCGSDGCGGSCGSCLISQTCTNGKCITPCVSDCILGQEQKECVLADSYKSRTCSDSSGCLKFGEWSSVSCKDKQKCLDGSCMACVENWVCQDWGACSKGLQTRV